jgi:hypothetical protein
MPATREIRVLPIVRYMITDWDGKSSRPSGLFDTAGQANRIGHAIAYEARLQAGAEVEFEPARALKIDVLRKPGQPRPLVNYVLREVAEAG